MSRKKKEQTGSTAFRLFWCFKGEINRCRSPPPGLKFKNSNPEERKKTHAYLMAAVIYRLFHGERQPVMISTSTIALQKALTEEYIPQISGILLEHRIIEEPLTFAVRKGKNHYACDSRVKTYLSSGGQEADGDSDRSFCGSRFP